MSQITSVSIGTQSASRKKAHRAGELFSFEKYREQDSNLHASTNSAIPAREEEFDLTDASWQARNEKFLRPRPMPSKLFSGTNKLFE
ncbi:MAG: hypothetical protein EAZ81_00010 [Verrucomicrobia bacterium]|nr:MAG: hypothetical protein EAZ81_00010 [Verrucomicrobiota bacterium]